MKTLKPKEALKMLDTLEASMKKKHWLEALDWMLEQIGEDTPVKELKNPLWNQMRLQAAEIGKNNLRQTLRSQITAKREEL